MAAGEVQHRQVLAAGTAAALLMSGCGTAVPEPRAAEGVERVTVALETFPDAEDALVQASFRLGAAMTAENPDGNQVTSPLSALYALAMLRAGAGTTTAAEMDGVLGLPLQHRDEAMNALLAEVQEYDGDPGAVDEDEPPAGPLLHLANGVFVNDGTPTGEAFLTTLARQYGAGVYPVDFPNPDTEGILDRWTSANTGARIEKAPLEYDPDTTLSLLSTVYFAAAWASPFDAEGTAPGSFALPGGSGEQVELMYGEMPVRYARGGDWQGVDIPYGEGFSMRLVLADDPAVSPVRTEEELLEVWDKMASVDEIRAGLVLPKWDHDHTQDLLGPLKALGLEETLGLTPNFDAIQKDILVSGAAQSANITVAEKGTVAAAVTQLGFRVSSAPMPPELTLEFTRPFLYQIIHDDTGLPVFLGTVLDPR
ncbi:serpin B [Arthrobacter sp. CAN_A214]|uniref:serpin family protein n=1 Tax=Arthrobacter sp. CAN_A214 TaxID=2787720 RepID=UPI0018C8F730